MPKTAKKMSRRYANMKIHRIWSTKRPGVGEGRRQKRNAPNTTTTERIDAPYVFQGPYGSPWGISMWHLQVPFALLLRLEPRHPTPSKTANAPRSSSLWDPTGIHGSSPMKNGSSPHEKWECAQNGSTEYAHEKWEFTFSVAFSVLLNGQRATSYEL